MLVSELGDTDIQPDVTAEPTICMEDNQGAIAMVEEPNKLHARTKHLAVKKHWVHEQVKNRVIEIKWDGLYKSSIALH